MTLSSDPSARSGESENSSLLSTLAEGFKPWAIPWPCLHEFVAIATHPKIFSPPSTLEQVLGQINAWRASPVLTLLSEGDDFVQSWESLLLASKVCGALAHDAKIASLCLAHGVSTLYSADRDFSRFSMLKVENPLI